MATKTASRTKKKSAARRPATKRTSAATRTKHRTAKAKRAEPDRGDDDTVDLVQLEELLLQSLEHEMGGVHVYETALKCVVDDDLREEWQKYLGETRNHVQVLHDACIELEVDPRAQSPGRRIVAATGKALVDAMTKALRTGDRRAAQLTACECVVLAETKDHLDWELLSEAAERLDGPVGKVLKRAVAEVEDEEDEHLYHSQGWCRELWLQSLGIEAVLPPPEEKKDVKTAIEAARAAKSRERSKIKNGRAAAAS